MKNTCNQHKEWASRTPQAEHRLQHRKSKTLKNRKGCRYFSVNALPSIIHDSNAGIYNRASNRILQIKFQKEKKKKGFTSPRSSRTKTLNSAISLPSFAAESTQFEFKNKNTENRRNKKKKKRHKHEPDYLKQELIWSCGEGYHRERSNASERTEVQYGWSV